MLPTLILGYGNPDREDDGVAWHILQKLAAHYSCPVTAVDDLEVEFQPEDGPETHQNDQLSSAPAAPWPLHLAFALQLTPEMAETLAHYERVCFVDAHTGLYDEAVRVVTLAPGYQASSFTHHLTPESCLALAQTLYGHAPAALLVSVRGYQFGYCTYLSERTAQLIPGAIAQIINWIA
jgi:Ni,Fe-hydrogenase maturation factor